MGWDTRITLLVECVRDEPVAVAGYQTQTDVQPFGTPNTTCFLESDNPQGGSPGKKD